MRNRGVSSPMPFLLIPRSLLRGGFILSEKVSRKWFFIGIAVANVGFLLWSFINLLLDITIYSTGRSHLVVLQKYIEDNFKGYLSAIWGMSSNWSIIVAIILIIRLRFGRLKNDTGKLLITTIIFPIFFAVSSTTFYHSGTNLMLVSSNLPVRVIELLSTAIWSIILSSITIL